MRINLREIAAQAVAIEFASFPALVGTDALWDIDGQPQEAFHVEIVWLSGGDNDNDPTVMIYEQSYMGGVNGEYDFVDIARSKCDVSARTGKSTRYVPAEDRLPGETEYWGSVVGDLKFEDDTAHQPVCLVIAGSGYKSEYDEAVCNRIGNTMGALVEIKVRIAREAGDDSPVEFFIGPVAA